ncbi:hypothetical protein, partial [Microcystis aeruginosa]|uniref:hypothetical protein n=1 Tax=Microcystis aeruginosa TaxID=1126 RepID=UPI000B0BE8EF
KDMAGMVRDKGNFILNFCETGKGDVGKTTLKELRTLLEDRVNIYLPSTDTRFQTKQYETGPGLHTNGVVGYKFTRWIQSKPGFQNILQVNSIQMSKDGATPLIIR